MEHPNLTRSLALLHLFSLVYLTLVHFSECCGLRESRSQRDRGASADERLQFSLVKKHFFLEKRKWVRCTINPERIQNMMNLNEAVAGAVASSLYPEMRFSWEIKVNQLCIQNFLRILYLKEILSRVWMPCFVMVWRVWVIWAVRPY